MMFKKVNFLFLFLLSGMVVVQASNTSKVLKSTNSTTTNSNIKNPNSKQKLELEKQRLTSPSSSSEKRPAQSLTEVQQRCQGSVSHESSGSRLSNCAFYSGVFCLSSTLLAGIITGSVLLTEYTHLVNETNDIYTVERQYSLTSPTRNDILYPGDSRYYPHPTWETFCVKGNSFEGYDKNCLSYDERTDGTRGCDNTEVRVKENENNGDPKLVKKSCGTKRRLRGFEKPSDLMTKKEIEEYAQIKNYLKFDFPFDK